jgi:tetratricopeptide (TPR) repeat protein
MRSLVPLIRTVGASMLFALAAALPAAAQREAQFQTWCFERATNERVIEGCRAVIAAGRESAEKLAQAYYTRGSAYLVSGENKRAIDDYSEALKRQPADAVVLLSRCHVRAIVGDLKAGLADCNESLRLAPSVPAALGSRGLVLLKLGRIDEAIADYDAGLKLYANSAISLYGRGVAKRRKGDVAGGDADIAAAKALRPDVADLMATWGVSAP